LLRELKGHNAGNWRHPFAVYPIGKFYIRTVAELSFMRFVRSYDSKEYGYYCAQFRLTNVGEVEIRSPTVPLNLPTNMMAEPSWDPKLGTAVVSTAQQSSDLFEAHGRIATVTPVPLLLRDHTITFFGLSLHFGSRYERDDAVSETDTPSLCRVHPATA
jgi:hypothetical protein